MTGFIIFGLSVVTLLSWALLYAAKKDADECTDRLMDNLLRAYARIDELEARLKRKARKAPYREVVIIPMAKTLPVIEWDEYSRN